MKKYLLIGLVVLVVALFGFVFIKRLLFPLPNTTAVVKEIQALNRWETSQYTIEKVIDAGTGGNVFQKFLFGNRILLIAHGQVIGGFDLTNLSQNSVEVNGPSIKLVLPPPQILVTRLDNEKTRVYDRQQGLLAPSNNNLEADARLTAENSIRQAACSEGVLKNASENAKKQLTSLFSSLGFTQISIDIPEATC